MLPLKQITTCLLLCLLIPLPFAAVSQISQYSLTTNNGLPSNHVYYLQKDRHGYLWIATNKGVIKYNGYNLKYFGLAEGMTNDDIWHLFEDNKGRLWLSSISTEMGYIFNDEYHRVCFKDSKVPIYPIYLHNNKEGIHFSTSNRRRRNYVCFEKNDTVSSYPFNPAGEWHLQQNRLLLAMDDAFYNVTWNGLEPVIKKNCNTFKNLNGYAFYDYLIPFPYQYSNGNPMPIFNTQNCSITPLYLEPDENIYMLYLYEDKCHLTSNKHIYELTKDMHIRKKQTIDDLLASGQLHANDAILYIEDSIWGKCLATNSNGLIFNYTQPIFQNIDSVNFKGCRLVGTSSNLDQFWWNKYDREMIIQKSNGGTIHKKHPLLYDVFSIISYDSAKSIMIASNGGIEWIQNSNGHIEPIFNKGYYSAGIVLSSDKILTASGGTGLNQIVLKADTAELTKLDENRYTHIVYDSVRKTFMASNHNAVYIGGDRISMRITPDILEKAGIKKIERIITDNTHGNILIQTANDLYAFDTRIFSLRRVFNHFNMDNARVALHNNILYAAGKFGLLCCTIRGYMDFSPTHLLPNIKTTQYNFVNDVCITANNMVELNTDKGLLAIHTPADSAFIKGTKIVPHKLIVTYNKKMYSSSNTFLHIDQRIPNLQFDIINPAGMGKVTYSYCIPRISKEWTNMNGNELHLSGLAPGEQYKIYVKATDDVWRMDASFISVTLTPYWWQTPNGRRVVWLVVVLLTAGIITGIIYATKRYVNRRNKQQNLQLELKNLNLALELKSIYSQINPHFIFNTLSTGLYFIKKKRIEEAYNHISSFSDLLRFYIKSSRSKFITIAEEVTNLSNYIMLQQARFENKLEYNIYVEPTIDATQTYIPTLLLQPLVENAIHHGLLPLEDDKGMLSIRFVHAEHTDVIQCIIDDNGIGRKQSKFYAENSNLKTESYGTTLIKELIDVLNRNENIEIALTYIDKEPPLMGTTVIITIKHLHNEQ